MNPMYHVCYGFILIAAFRSLKQVNAYVARITAEHHLDGSKFEVRFVKDSPERNEYVSRDYR